MRTSTLVAASMAVASAAADAGCGSAIIKNNCAQTVYLFDTKSQDMPTPDPIAPGASFTQEYVEKVGGGGVSLKLGLDTTCSNVMQFEYTKKPTTVWYDMSTINGSPFDSMGGFTVTPSTIDSANNCNPVSCGVSGKGNANCNIYRQPDDNIATLNCALATSLTVELCPGGPNGSVGQNIIPVGSPTSAPAQISQAPVTQAAPAYTPPASSSTLVAVASPAPVAAPVVAAPAPVEIATPAVAPPSPYGIVTFNDVMPDLHGKAKRHQHHPAHDHAAAQE